uniref:Uncharacterized protein n=1 Tax=Marseillevirus LCMAC201 TaxID=2506605 RepID=A0A481YWG0_9VIRU|nr:MAG: hypothetical protein LCMAC201_04530 [Marseillevirus LCMAC201]
MDATVINNSGDDIQVYLKCTNNSTGSDQPKLQDLSSEMLPVVGSTTSADAPIMCTNEKLQYIFAGIWNDKTSIGKPNSWLTFDIKSLGVLNSSYDNYQTSISGTKDKGYILTITDSDGLPSQNGNIWLIILIGVFILFLLIGIGSALFFAFRKGSSSHFVQNELPFFVPKY